MSLEKYLNNEIDLRYIEKIIMNYRDDLDYYYNNNYPYINVYNFGGDGFYCGVCYRSFYSKSNEKKIKKHLMSKHHQKALNLKYDFEEILNTDIWYLNEN